VTTRAQTAAKRIVAKRVAATRRPRKAVKLTPMQRLEYERRAAAMSWDGKYAYEIAAELGVHESTVDRMLKRARQRIEPIQAAEEAKRRADDWSRWRDGMRREFGSDIWDPVDPGPEPPEHTCHLPR
jgi:IS30 family transposase